MKLTLTPTAEFQKVDGVMCRVWEGEDAAGTPVKAAIRYVQPQTHDEARLKVFETTLQKLPKPVPDGLVVELRFIL